MKLCLMAWGVVVKTYPTNANIEQLSNNEQTQKYHQVIYIDFLMSLSISCYNNRVPETG